MCLGRRGKLIWGADAISRGVRSRRWGATCRGDRVTDPRGGRRRGTGSRGDGLLATRRRKRRLTSTHDVGREVYVGSGPSGVREWSCDSY